MATTVFAGAWVRDLDRAVRWYDKLLGASPSFRPNDVEAVWELGEGRFVYVEVERVEGSAGHGLLTLFLGSSAELATWTGAAAERGIAPQADEVYENGVRKVTYRDPDGNEIGLGAPPEAD